MKKVQQVFAKGINRRIPKDQSAPDRLHTLQNARIYQKGDTLHVTRIKGTGDWPIHENTDPIAVLAFPASFDTTGYQRGFRYRLSHFALVDESFPKTFGEDIIMGEDFWFSVRTLKFNFVEPVRVNEKETVRAREVQRFVDSTQVGENLNNTNFVRFSFVEGVATSDTPLQQQPL
jgi:hypothetical protein